MISNKHNKHKLLYITRDNKVAAGLMLRQGILYLFISFCQWFDAKSKAKYFVD